MCCNINLVKPFENYALLNTRNDHMLLSKWQSGFTPGDSTMNQLVSIYHTLVEALDHKKDVRLVFCDISSAFDRVWHRGLLHKLHNIGFQGKLHVWLHDYLSERYHLSAGCGPRKIFHLD